MRRIVGAMETAAGRCLAVVVGVALLAGVAAAQAPARGGTFSVPIADNPKIWPLVGGLPNILVNKVLYSCLIRYDPTTLAPRGDLAESWSASDDGLSWTFKLRKNVKWHDGKPFTARDVKFTVDVWMNREVPFYLRASLTGLTRVETVDDHTVRLTFGDRVASLPVLLGYLMNILPEHQLGALSPKELINPTAFLRKPIGTGPFVFAEFVPGSHVRLTANPDYHDGRPHLNAIVFRVVPDLDAQIAQLLTGQLDLAVIEPNQIAAVEKAPQIQLDVASQVNYTYIAPNNVHPLFQDRRVRQALTYGIDRKEILDRIALGRGRLATGPISPSLEWVYNPRVKQYPYDPELARRLLGEVGWRPGPGGILHKDGRPFAFTIESDKGNPVREQIAIVAQQYWKQLGLDVKLAFHEFNVLLKNYRELPPKYEALQLWYITPPEPDLTAYYGTGGAVNNFAYSNPEVDRLLREGRTTLDPARRAQIYGRMQEILAEDAPVVYLYYPQEIRALQRRVKGFAPVGYRDALVYAHRIWLER